MNRNLQYTNANSASISEMEIGMQRAKGEKRARGSRTQGVWDCRRLGPRPGRVGSGRVGSSTWEGDGNNGGKVGTRPS